MSQRPPLAAVREVSSVCVPPEDSSSYAQTPASVHYHPDKESSMVKFCFTMPEKVSSVKETLFDTSSDSSADPEIQVSVLVKREKAYKN